MEQITVFSIVYNNYGKFIPQWNEYMNNQTISVKKFIVLGHNHGADMQYLKENNIDYIYYDSDVMGVLRNKGLERVKTNWWFYFAIDDELLPHACEEIVNTDADAISIRFNAIDVDGRLLKDQNSPHLKTISDVKNWKNTKWGGYTAIRGNTDLRYNEDVEVPNLTLHFELFKRNLKVVKSNSILVVHHRWSESHHFRSEKDGSRRRSISEIDRIAQQIIKDKENELKKMKYLVRANENWKNKKLKCNDFNPKRIPEVGEEWEVDGARLETLLGDNIYNVAFVEVVNQIEEEVTEHQDWRVSPPLKNKTKEILVYGPKTGRNPKGELIIDEVNKVKETTKRTEKKEKISADGKKEKPIKKTTEKKQPKKK